jgi:hypothetical protein
MAGNESEHTFQINLLENGVDFILKGIDELFNEDMTLREYVNALDITPENYKYGVIHLFAGFLLLLKERLYRHMEELIFTGRINDIKQKLKSGKKPITVTLDEALERLEMGPRFVFEDDDLKVIRRMQDYRNQLEHYKVSVNKHEIWRNISKFLGIIDKFLTEQLQINIEDSANNLELVGKIQGIEAIWKRIEKQKVDGWRLEMEKQLADFEGNRQKVLDDLQHEYFIEKGAIEIFIECPECYQDTLIVYGEYIGICSNEECLSINPITSCARCGRTTVGFPWEFNICDDCMDTIKYQG